MSRRALFGLLGLWLLVLPLDAVAAEGADLDLEGLSVDPEVFWQALSRMDVDDLEALLMGAEMVVQQCAISPETCVDAAARERLGQAFLVRIVADYVDVGTVDPSLVANARLLVPELASTWLARLPTTPPGPPEPWLVDLVLQARGAAPASSEDDKRIRRLRALRPNRLQPAHAVVRFGSENLSRGEDVAAGLGVNARFAAWRRGPSLAADLWLAPLRFAGIQDEPVDWYALVGLRTEAIRRPGLTLPLELYAGMGRHGRNLFGNPLVDGKPLQRVAILRLRLAAEVPVGVGVLVAPSLQMETQLSLRRRVRLEGGRVQVEGTALRWTGHQALVGLDIHVAFPRRGRLVAQPSVGISAWGDHSLLLPTVRLTVGVAPGGAS